MANFDLCDISNYIQFISDVFCNFYLITVMVKQITVNKHISQQNAQTCNQENKLNSRCYLKCGQCMLVHSGKRAKMLQSQLFFAETLHACNDICHIRVYCKHIAFKLTFISKNVLLNQRGLITRKY